MRVELNLSRIDDYELFLRIKALPQYRFVGRMAEFPDEYADRLGFADLAPTTAYKPLTGLFDYQRDISAIAIQKRKYAVFADCGLGKTLILLEFARHAAENISGRSVLIVAPLMVVGQTIKEATRFYGDTMPITRVRAADLPKFLATGTGIGITNYEAITEKVASIVNPNLGALILDESSMLKSHYGKFGQRLIRMGRGLEWKLCLTGTPAPNDRIEFANHAVLLDREPTVNAFLARYFVNRGETQNRWELKAHALRPFYRSLSHWCIFLNNPATYGWKDNVANVPPINTHIHDVSLTKEQREIAQTQTGSLFVSEVGGITSRGVLSQLAKGTHQGKAVKTNKTRFIRDLVRGFNGAQTIIWCLYNREQELMGKTFPDAANISGDTKEENRIELIEDFQAGRRPILISKPKVLGFGLNFQCCTQMVFSGIQDSWESYYQAVKRANRYGSMAPLDVHIPVTEIERPMLETVLRKADRIRKDTDEQEQLFREVAGIRLT